MPLAQPSTARTRLNTRRVVYEGFGRDDDLFELDRCHALDTTSDTVQMYYPQWYRGAA